MFRILNRLLKLASLAALVGGGFLLWQQRDRARPLTDAA